MARRKSFPVTVTKASTTIRISGGLCPVCEQELVIGDPAVIAEGQLIHLLCRSRSPSMMRSTW